MNRRMLQEPSEQPAPPMYSCTTGRRTCITGDNWTIQDQVPRSPVTVKICSGPSIACLQRKVLQKIKNLPLAATSNGRGKRSKKNCRFLAAGGKLWHTAYIQLADSQTGTIPTLLPNMASSDTDIQGIYERSRPSFLLRGQRDLYQSNKSLL